MESSRVARQEHFALATKLSLDALCSRVRRAFALPAFRFGEENATEWGWVELDEVEYNVSRPFKRATLCSWDSSVPQGCNVGIFIALSTQHPRCADSEWVLESLVPSVGTGLHEALGASIHHHRTWTADGNVTRASVFT